MRIIAEELGCDLVDFVDTYVRSKGQIQTPDQARLQVTAEGLGAPVKHIALAASRPEVGLTASYFSGLGVRELEYIPTKSNVNSK